MHKLLISSIAMSAAMMMTPVFAQGTPAAGETPVVETPVPTAVMTAPEGFSVVGFDTVTAEQLIGAGIHDSKGSEVGVVADVVLGTDEKITDIVSDIGGFLGMDAHRALLNPDQVEIYTNADGETQVYVLLSDEELKALSAYEPE